MWARRGQIESTWTNLLGLNVPDAGQPEQHGFAGALTGDRLHEKND